MQLLPKGFLVHSLNIANGEKKNNNKKLFSNYKGLFSLFRFDLKDNNKSYNEIQSESINSNPVINITNNNNQKNEIPFNFLHVYFYYY